MSDPLLLQNAEQYVRQLFATLDEEAFTYHNIAHTESVVRASAAMADYYQLSSEDRLALMLAAWFHDTGYTKGSAEGHEEDSKLIASAYLMGKGRDEQFIQMVAHAIGATRMPQSPANLIEQILCDADLYHLGTEEFATQHKSLRRELMELGGAEIKKKDWRKTNIEFLQQHRYFTEYARLYLEPRKQQNLALLTEKENGKHKKPIDGKLPPVEEALPKKKHPDPITVAENIIEKAKPEEKLKKEKEKESRTDRGIGTMFRIMSDNHVSLSQMADSKANIMISVNTIVLSILISVLLSKLQYYPQFIFPTILLSIVCLCAIIFAILATRPNVTRGTFTHEDVQQKRINLLFFGNFFKMELPDYEWAMKEMMNDREYLYGSMIKDIYFLGKVLAKKYKYLRMSYNIFMFGLVISILSFGIALYLSA